MQIVNHSEITGGLAMKTAILLAVASVTLSSLPLALPSNGNAQQVSATAQENSQAAGANANQSTNAGATAGAGGAQVNGSAESSAAAEMRPVSAELVSKLDSKSAKTGDAVIVKTTEKVKTADGTVIPKGSRLAGHVTDVQAHGSGHADSSMSIAFERAELKGGQNVAIHSVIQSVAPPASAMAAGALDSDESMSAPMGGGAMGGAHAVGGGRAGGAGLVGGAASSATGGVASNLGSTPGGALRTTGSVANGATADVGRGVRATEGATGSLATHATGIPGVMLAGDASGAASGTLSASRRNVHLDSGTQLVLGISGATNMR
jgi:hypothetical protein